MILLLWLLPRYVDISQGTAARLKSVDDGLPKEFTSSTKQHKAWVPARDKDLTPADLTSHSVPSATYRCDVSINDKLHRNNMSSEL